MVNTAALIVWQVQVAVAVKDVEGEAPDMAQQRAHAVKEFIQTGFSLEPVTENSAYITYLIGHADEQRLPDLLRSLESNTTGLGVADIQACFRPCNDYSMSQQFET